ncbi:putative serine esterase-domain-containing protein [Mycena sp. CBHHK59/15]|nr:putative serine esterase-domain-containing protein [Mycena sp. CBHHK59/15]
MQAIEPNPAIHLHLLIHGLQGHPRHLAEAIHFFNHRWPADPALVLLVPASLTYQHTYDGIDWNAHRVLHELDQAIHAIEKDGGRVTRFSVTSYSLGGLIARYVVGALHARGFFDAVDPVNFTSFTTPHAGIPPPPHTSRLLFWLGSTVLGRTGTQFHLLDSWADTGQPLLQAMAYPASPFFRGLSRFRHINIYANAINDVTVPYFSGAFEEEDPFAGVPEHAIIPEYLPNYEPVLHDFSIAHSAPRLAACLRSLRPLAFNGPLVAWVFPWNLILYLLLPLLLPLGILYFTFDSVRSARASRARIRILRAAVPAPLLPAFAVPGSPEPESPTTRNASPAPPNASPAPPAPPVPPPMAPAQVAIVRALNTLRGVRKHTVFRPHVRNAHAMIICLEPRFADHRVGRGVLRHWVDNFEV